MDEAQTPNITTEPADDTVDGTEEFTLTVVAEVGNGLLTYQWFEATTWDGVGTLISGATTPELKLSKNVGGIYYYYVIVTNTITDQRLNMKTAAEQSRSACITVDITPAPAPINVEISVPRTVFVGDPVIVSVSADLPETNPGTTSLPLIQ